MSYKKRLKETQNPSNMELTLAATSILFTKKIEFHGVGIKSITAKHMLYDSSNNLTPYLSVLDFLNLYFTKLIFELDFCT